MEEAWSFEQKKNFVLEMLYNEAGSIGRNQVWLVPRTVTGGESEYDPTFLYKKEYGHILEILEFENLLRVLDRDSEKGFHVELLERANKQASWYVQDGYKTIGDVLLNAELRESLLKIILRAYGISDAREFDRKRSTKTAVDERRDGLYQDEKILLLEALGIVKADWDGMKKQTHRPFGNRLIEVYFNGEKAGDFVDALLGKKSLIEKRVLKLIAENLSKLKPDAAGYFWSDFFIEQGIPSSLFPTNSPDLPLPLFIYEVLVILSSTENEQNKQLLERALSETVHPLFYDGDEDVAKKQEYELNKLLKFSGLILREGQLLHTANEPQQQSSSPSKPIIRAKAIEQLSWLIKDMMPESQLRDLFSNAGVPSSMTPTESGSKQKLVYGVLNALSTSADAESKALLFRVLEETGHPLYSGNDMARAKETQIKLTKMIRYDELSVIGGVMHKFDEKDEVAITAFEEDRNKVDPALAESLNGFLGNMFPPRSAPKVNTQPPPSVGTAETHIHFHNATQVTQSVQLPSFGTDDPKKEVVKTTKSLKDAEISFDDDTATIQINGTDCKLPPTTNQHLFCRAMFQYRKGEAVDWSVISEVMTGKKWIESPTEATKTEKQAVRDAMYAVNKRVAEVYRTEDKLFSMSEKSVIRAY